MANVTWSLVPNQPHLIVIGNKRVFRLKRNSDGSIARHKAGLVSKGVHQWPDIDYKDTFSHVIKPQTIKMVLCISFSKCRSLTQIGVNNALFHGPVSGDVYMRQPKGFIHQTFPNHVCKLHKALYGLKHEPRAWYHELKSFVVFS